jgi:hypothetical protein
VTIDIDYDALNTTIAELTTVTGVGDPDEELLTAANFVFRFGALGEFLEEPNLTKAQFWTGPSGTAFSLLGHWSVARNDPTHGEEPRQDFEVHTEDCDTPCGFLEDVLTARGVFEFQNCEECGGGIAAHAVVELPIGKPGLICVGQWTRIEPETVDMGPDYYAAGDFEQTSDSAWATSWWAPLADGEFAVVTRTYLIGRRAGRATLLRVDDYTACTDYERFRDTETVSDWSESELDSGDPGSEDLHQLAVDSFAPEPGEWPQDALESAEFAVPADA